MKIGLYGRNIACFVPTEFTEAQSHFAEHYCWVSGTYFLKPTEDVPKPDGRGEELINYVQWIAPLFLALAVLFYAPSLAWRVTSRFSGISVCLPNYGQLMTIKDSVIYLLMKNK